jgi:hypothetical protein
VQTVIQSLKKLLKTALSIWIIAAFFCGCAGTPASSESQRITAPIITDIEAARVATLVVRKLPWNYESNVSVPCEFFGTEDSIVRMNFGKLAQDKLAKALARTVCHPAIRGDMRWHADLVDTNGKTLHTICLDSGYLGFLHNVASVDGAVFRVNSPLRKWFKSQFSEPAKGGESE